MRVFSFFLLLLFFEALIEASYIRSIRVGSFPTQEDAQTALVTLQEFVQEHPNIISLQEKHHFVYRTRSSGKYFITIIEPFYDRVVLQEVLDTLRLEYQGIYVTKLTQSYLEENNLDIMENLKQSTPKTVVQKPIQITQPTYTLETSIPKQSSVEVVQPQKQAKVVSVVKTQEEQHSGNIIDIFFWILLTLFVVLLAYILKTKKENERRENTLMITREKFEQAHRAIENKEKLLSHVSHELRTPLTAIMGLTHLALEDEPTVQQSDYLQRIEGSANHLLNIINDILDVSKIEAGALQLEEVEFDLNDVLEYVLNVVSVQAQKNGNVLSLDVEQDIPAKLLGDPLRLGQVIINLVGNAVKFTHNGEVSLEIKLHSSFDGNVILKFIISDTGIGMSQNQIEKIFNSYIQADESVSRKYGGTGLGLSISKQLIELMKGEIRVDSTKEKGTVFTFSASFRQQDLENHRQYRFPSENLLHKKVLIVHPIDKNILMLIRAFDYFNYETYKIPSFEEATLHEELNYDIIVIGQECISPLAIENIKEFQKKHPAKVVLLNDRISTSSARNIDGLEIDGYLKVPLTQLSVLNLLIELYTKQKEKKKSHISSYKDELKEMQGKKVLIAEDNELNHKVIKGLLNDTGIELCFVFNGEEALEKLDEQEFDLVLMDINMPTMDGYKATQKIRQNAKYDKLPIIALSADVMEEAIRKVLESGMQGHIAKPIVVDIFYKKILDSLKFGFSAPSRGEEEDFSQENQLYNEISISVGLAKYNQSAKFYQSVLKDFKLMYINSAKTLLKLCQDGDFHAARKMARTIKDTALNIGAYNVFEAAATMEYELEKGQRSSWSEFIPFYDKELQKLFKDIDKYLLESE
ncbi:ATP-binding protein [Sulfurimonas sp.]|uniref:ATP-binding protein n=1 Tax=Sulfurimonas sp. TaxID=2022749 RepID=UPI003D0AA1E4